MNMLTETTRLVERELPTLQKNLANVSKDLHTGHEHQTFDEFPYRVKGYLADVGFIDSVRSVREGLSGLDQILAEQENSINLIIAQADVVHSGLLGALDDANSLFGFDQTLNFAISQIEKALNGQDGQGCYVFGQDVRATKAVDFSQIQTATVTAGGDTSVEYYAGGVTPLEIRSDSGEGTLSSTLSAKNAAMEKIVRALHLAKEAVTNSNKPQARTAHTLLKEGLDEVADNMLRVVGESRRVLKENLDILDDERLAATERISEEANVDVGAKVNELAQAQMALTVSMEVTKQNNRIIKDFLASYGS